MTTPSYPLVGRCRDCGRESPEPPPCAGCGQADAGWWCRACAAWLDRPLCGVCGGLDVPAEVFVGQVLDGVRLPFAFAIHNRTAEPLPLALRADRRRVDLAISRVVLGPGQRMDVAGTVSVDGGDAAVELVGPLGQRVALRSRRLNCGVSGPGGVDFGTVRGGAVVTRQVEFANACDAPLGVAVEVRGAGLSVALTRVTLVRRGTATVAVRLDPASAGVGAVRGMVYLTPEQGEPRLIRVQGEVTAEG